ncbi:MAG: hypothetical protein LBR00_02560, partial [Clostridiales Family XIII bacterium]|nr:hypothetical protein [Clostridiales Family XIII bacterium]
NDNEEDGDAGVENDNAASEGDAGVEDDNTTSDEDAVTSEDVGAGLAPPAETEDTAAKQRSTLAPATSEGATIDGTIDKAGVMTALKKGTAKITVKYGGKSVKVTVKVE